MRILSITAQKPDSTGSGVYLTELVRAIGRNNIEQAVVAGVYHDDNTALPNGVSFFPVYFDTPALPFKIVGMSDEMPYESTRYRDMTPDMAERFKLSFIDAISRAIAAFSPDIIICHHLYLLTSLVRESFSDHRVYGICHGTDLRQMYTNPLFHNEIIAGIQKLDGIFCLHEEQKNRIQACYGVPADKIVIAGNGYNSGVFRNLNTPPHDGIHISFAGKISEKKGVFSLIHALEYLPYPKDTVRVSLAGGYANEDHNRAKELISRCKYDVELLGALPQDRLAELFNDSDLFVLPSFYDALPLVLVEALACGARVICTDLPGIKDRMDAVIPNNGIRFIAPPRMVGTDIPDEADLPRFEAALGRLIVDALNWPAPMPELSGVSWDGVAKSMLDTMK